MDPGLDIAGSYIREHKNPQDIVMHSSGQSYGFLWYADMKGYKIPPTPDILIKAEKDYNVSWLFVYQWRSADRRHPDDHQGSHPREQ